MVHIIIEWSHNFCLMDLSPGSDSPQDLFCFNSRSSKQKIHWPSLSKQSKPGPVNLAREPSQVMFL